MIYFGGRHRLRGRDPLHNDPAVAVASRFPRPITVRTSAWREGPRIVLATTTVVPERSDAAVLSAELSCW